MPISKKKRRRSRELNPSSRPKRELRKKLKNLRMPRKMLKLRH